MTAATAAITLIAVARRANVPRGPVEPGLVSAKLAAAGTGPIAAGRRPGRIARHATTVPNGSDTGPGRTGNQRSFARRGRSHGPSVPGSAAL